MFLVEYSFIYKILSCIFLGIVIKILDDYVDGDTTNYILVRLTLNNNKAILPYCLIIFAIATGFNDEYAVTLLSSCYIVGMFHDLNLMLPSKLKSYHESIIIALLNILFYNFISFFTSLLLIFFIQLFDDVKDMNWDKKYGFKNFANIFGKVEIILFSLILLLIIGLIDAPKLVIVFGSFIIVDFLLQKNKDNMRI